MTPLHAAVRALVDAIEQLRDAVIESREQSISRQLVTLLDIPTKCERLRAALDSEPDEETRQLRRMLWLVIQAAGGEVRVKMSEAVALDDGASFHRWDDTLNNEIVFRVQPAARVALGRKANV